MSSKLAKKQTHAVFDEASLERQRKETQREAHHEILKLSVAAIRDTERYVLENDLSNYEKQQGKQLQSDLWEQKVKKLVPSIYFCTKLMTEHERTQLGLGAGINCRLMGIAAPDGFQYVSSYPDLPVRPEWTLMIMRKERIAGEKQHISMKDVPELTYDPEKDDWLSDSPMPWEEYAYVPGVPCPGWRTDLAKLVMSGFASADAVEREFGAPVDNATWALRLGKQTAHAPEVLV